MRNRRFLLLIIIIVIIPVSVLGEDGGVHHFDWTGFFGKVVNSSILFGLLIYYFRKPLIEFLGKKSVEIREDLTKREIEVKDNKVSLKKIEERLVKIESEVDEMLAEAKKTGERETEKIEKLAKAESERIIRNSSDEIEARIESSIVELKKKIADMTIEEFRKNYKSVLDRNIHKKIVEKNIEIIGEIIEKS